MTSSSASHTGRRPTLGGVLAAVGGVALFIYFIRRAGVDDVAQGIGRLGWSFLVVVALGGIRFLIRAAAWMRCLDGRHRVRLRDAFQAVIAGDALGNLTPLSLIVSEPAKAMFIRHREPLGRTLPALAIENLFYTLSAMLVIAGGLVALLLMLQTPGQLWRATTILIVTMVALVVVAHWVIWNHIPVGSGTLHWLSARGVATTLTGRAASRLQQLEQHIYALYPREWSRLFPLAVLELSFHVFAVLEIYLVLSIISGHQPTLLDAFVFESTNRFIAVAFKFVPMRIGVDEAGTGMFADLLAFGTTAGVTLAIVRKGRMLVWMALGVVVLAARGLTVKGVLATAAAPAAIVVMARSPLTGNPPKTRLADTVEDEGDRRRLYASFLEDTLTACRSVPSTALRVAYTPDGGPSGFGDLGVTEDELLPQRGTDLGARECHAFEDLFAAGFEKVVMVGSDLPTLPMSHVAQAIDQASPGRVVLGPSEDGGYYLIALGAPKPGDPVPDLFQNIRWSTSSALDDTYAAASRIGLQIARVPAWHDVDDSAGLETLRAELMTEEGRRRAPRTAEELRRIARKETEDRKRETE